jgi:hypothetical protein
MVAATKPRRNLDRVIQIYNRQGWYPVPWRHHPPEIRALIRALGFRPQLKGCYMNSQRLFVGNLHLATGLDLEYREGWVQTIIPIQHSWLLYKGEILDLTLDSHGVQYLESVGIPLARVLAHMVRTGNYGPVLSEQEYYEIGPFRGLWEKLNELNQRNLQSDPQT